MERKVRAVRNWNKVKDMLLGKKNAPLKLTSFSLFEKKIIEEDENHKIVQYCHK
jgi:hypothetical protein